jgi:hypothetical protein
MQIVSQILRQNKRRHLWRKYCRNLERNFDGNSVAIKHANKKRIKLDVLHSYAIACKMVLVTEVLKVIVCSLQ